MMLNEPGVPGVPVIAPDAEIVSPAGSWPAASDHEYGGVPPVATADELYAWPASADGAGQLATERPDPMAIENDCVVLTFALSVTRAVKLEEPAFAGVPA